MGNVESASEKLYNENLLKEFLPSEVKRGRELMETVEGLEEWELEELEKLFPAERPNNVFIAFRSYLPHYFLMKRALQAGWFRSRIISWITIRFLDIHVDALVPYPAMGKSQREWAILIYQDLWNELMRELPSVDFDILKIHSHSNLSEIENSIDPTSFIDFLAQSKITKLELTGSLFSGENVAVLAKALMGNNTLRRLKLVNNTYTGLLFEPGGVMYDWLSQQSNIISLVVEEQNASPRGVSLDYPMFKILEKNTTLKNLQIEIPKYVDGPLYDFVDFIEKNESVEHLNLSYNPRLIYRQIGFWFELVHALGKNKTLLSLQLGGNYFWGNPSDAKVIALARLLMVHPTLTEITITEGDFRNLKDGDYQRLKEILVSSLTPNLDVEIRSKKLFRPYNPNVLKINFFEADELKVTERQQDFMDFVGRRNEAFQRMRENIELSLILKREGIPREVTRYLLKLDPERAETQEFLGLPPLARFKGKFW
jgi:hypothetical protein